MEYVQKAIELARQQRLEKAGSANPEASIAEVERSAETSKPKDSPISYSQTRRVELDLSTLKNNRIVAAFDNDDRAEPYRQLRTRILQEFKKHKWRTLAMTSAHQGEGKTLTAINTAIALAKEVNQTVLLVDLDFKDPDIAQALGIPLEAGLVEYLRGTASLQDVMINPGLERLVIVPSLPVTAGSTSEILSSPRMKATLEEMINRYPERIILFDLPPLLRDDDAMVFTPYVDASLLVVEYGVAEAKDVERCIQLLKDTNLLGTIFNKRK